MAMPDATNLENSESKNQKAESAPVSGTTAVPTTPTPPPVTKPTVVVKQTLKKVKRLSPKLVVIGCVGFIVLFIVGLFGALYAGLSSPGKLANIGIDPSNAKSLLMIIAGVFFGVIFFIGFGFLAVNTFRIIKKKSVSKTKYIAGMFFGFVLLAFSIGLGAVAITKVQAIKITLTGNSDQLIIPYLLTTTTSSTTQQFTYANAKNVFLIAPLDVAFQINADIVNLKYKNIAGNIPPVSMTLDCGNGPSGGTKDDSEKVPGTEFLAGTNKYFDNTCLYPHKGTYNLKIIFVYKDQIKQQNQQFSLDAGSITIGSEMKLTTADGSGLALNANSSELVAGSAPVRLEVNATDIFSQLGLSDNSVIWDMDGDGAQDVSNKVNFGYNYMDPKLYSVAYRFPNSQFPTMWYHFYVRVNQSDTPRCTISATSQGNTYSFTTNRSGTDVVSKGSITSYHWEIDDANANKMITTVPTRDDTFQYVFWQQGDYTARMLFTTVDNAQGFCESDVIHAGSANYNIKYKMTYKIPGDATFSDFSTTGGNFFWSGDSIVLNSVPVDVKLSVIDISPKPLETILNAKIGDTYMVKSQDGMSFDATISDSKDQMIALTLQDEQGNKVEKDISIHLDQSAIIGILQATPVAGTDPLTVTLDASPTKLNDASDEIIYFTWDFGDGQSAQNVSQGQISHIYRFDPVKQSGTYNPTVTVSTKKWFHATFGLDTPISVKRQITSVNITLPSNPTQVAQQGSNVDMVMESDGLINKITRDYGDGVDTSCDDRSCAETSHAYSKPGTYTIRVSVDYQNLPSATQTTKIKVE